MEAFLLDWLILLGRWLHLVTGIAWIGASFYFVWLDDNLQPPSDPDLQKKASAASCGRCTAAASIRPRRHLYCPRCFPHRCIGSSGRLTGRGCRGFFCCA